MTNHAVLLQEINTLPAAYVNEVIDFVAWIKHRKLRQELPSQIPEPMLLSEASLAKERITPEEDEAWAYQAMAADTEREQEAREWCNAYFGPVRK